MADVTEFGLREAIVTLRRELKLAQDDAAGENLQFAVEGIELELQLVATQQESGDVGFKVPLFSAGLQASDTSAITQRVKLNLRPAGPAGDLPVRSGNYRRP